MKRKKHKLFCDFRHIFNIACPTCGAPISQDCYINKYKKHGTSTYFWTWTWPAANMGQFDINMMKYMPFAHKSRYKYAEIIGILAG